MIDNEVIKKLILDLTDLVVKFNSDLNKGKINNIVPKTKEVFNKYTKLCPELNDIIALDSNYGLNLEITNFTWKILIPAFLYKNSFRLHIIRKLKSYLQKEITFDEINVNKIS